MLAPWGAGELRRKYGWNLRNMRRKKKHADVITDKDENSVATLEKKKNQIQAEEKKLYNIWVNQSDHIETS